MKQLTLVAVVVSTLSVSLNAMQETPEWYNPPQRIHEFLSHQPRSGPKETFEKLIVIRKRIIDFDKRRTKEHKYGT